MSEKYYNDLKNLREMVNKLIICPNGDIIKRLQEIGDSILTDYTLRVGNHVIRPLWVEAYYYDEDHGFMDESVHKYPCQKGHFGYLYFHHKVGDRRSGVDICLSDGSYYLSYLLKYMLVDDVFISQSKLHNLIYDQYNCGDQVLFPEQNQCKIICHTSRIMGKSNANCKYLNEELACVRDINLRFTDENGKTKSLPHKEALLKAYIEETYPAAARKTEEDKKRISKELVGEYWRRLF